MHPTRVRITSSCYALRVRDARNEVRLACARVSALHRDRRQFRGSIGSDGFEKEAAPLPWGHRSHVTAVWPPQTTSARERVKKATMMTTRMISLRRRAVGRGHARVHF